MSAAATADLLWPSFSGPSQLAAGRVRSAERPRSAREHLRAGTRAAELWPDRPAVPDAESFHTPLVRTFGSSRATCTERRPCWPSWAWVAATRSRSSRSTARSCCRCCLPQRRLVSTPRSTRAWRGHAVELVRLSRAKVIVASGPELDERVWVHARAIAANTGGRALLALRPTAASDEPTSLEPLDGVEVACLQERMADAEKAGLPGAPPAPEDIGSYLHRQHLHFHAATPTLPPHPLQLPIRSRGTLHRTDMHFRPANLAVRRCATRVAREGATDSCAWADISVSWGPTRTDAVGPRPAAASCRREREWPSTVAVVAQLRRPARHAEENSRADAIDRWSAGQAGASHRQPARPRWARHQPGRCGPSFASSPPRCRVRVIRPDQRGSCGGRQSGRRSTPGPGRRR